MTPETLEALKASIAKWERNAVAETPWDYTTSSDDCPLCVLFYEEGCVGCPVSAKTGKSSCDKTPYRTTLSPKFRWHDGDMSARQAALDCAANEVAFLKSLLPPEEPVAFEGFDGEDFV